MSTSERILKILGTVGPLPACRVARALGLSPSTASQRLCILHQAGRVVRAPVPDHYRRSSPAQARWGYAVPEQRPPRPVEGLA